MPTRRQILKAGAALFTASGVTFDMAEAEEKMRIYEGDLNELAKAFPAGKEPPKLLKSLAHWMTGKPWQSIGSFDLALDWCDSHLLGGEFYYDDFALFIRLPDGSAAGYWLAGGNPANAPIVVLGSEGQYKTLAPDLETLLARIVLGDFRKKGPEAEFLYPNDDFASAPDLRGDLHAFLTKETRIQDIDALARQAKSMSEEFTGWAERATKSHNTRLQAHPAILAMMPILAKYRPRNAQPWEGTRIKITWAGDDFRASLLPDGPRPFDEAEKIRPHLAALRNEAAEKKSGLGLWHSAILTVYEAGPYLVPDYMHAPDFGQQKPPVGAFKADQARTPRESRRIPPWLAAILDS